MTPDADRLLELDEAIGRLGAMAYNAWNSGTPSYGEVVEEVVITCEDLFADDQPFRDQLAAVLPQGWPPDMSLTDRIKGLVGHVENLVELRQSWLNCIAAQGERIRELEVKARDFGEAPTDIDPMAVVKLRRDLERNPRSMTISRPLVQLLRGVFGVTNGARPTSFMLTCPHCSGERLLVDDRVGPVDCVRCEGKGEVPDVDALRVRLAEMEIERRQLREAAHKGIRLMARMDPPKSDSLEALWRAFNHALNPCRNNGYENSDHPDDFTAPTQPLEPLVES